MRRRMVMAVRLRAFFTGSKAYDNAEIMADVKTGVKVEVKVKNQIYR